MTRPGLDRCDWSVAGARALRVRRRSLLHVLVAQRGVTAIEVLFAVATSMTLAAVSIAQTSTVVDELRTAVAARYVAGRIGAARLDAVRRGTSVALRFELAGDDYVYTPVEDGNGNGVRTPEIRAGVDRALGAAERLRDKFADVRFELGSGVPDADGEDVAGDGVRIGSSRILTLSADGTATSGTLYIRGRRAQYAVRVLGTTGRTRMLQYSAGNRLWLSR